MNPVARVQRWAGQVFGSNSKPAAVSQRENKIQNVMGVSSNIIDPNKQSSAVRAIAPRVSKDWGHSSYANPLNNTIAINDYQPGSQPYVEAHEAGHLSFEQAGPAKFFGVSGRTVTGLSDNLGNPAPLELLGGFLTKTFDASEEDRAERLSAKYGRALGGNPENAPSIDSRGRSQYGNNLRSQGNQRMAGAVEPVVNMITTARNSILNPIQSNQRAAMEPEIRNLTTQYRTMIQNENAINTPEFQKIDQQLNDYRDRYNNQGGNFEKFVGSF